MRLVQTLDEYWQTDAKKKAFLAICGHPKTKKMASLLEIAFNFGRHGNRKITERPCQHSLDRYCSELAEFLGKIAFEGQK